MNIQLKQLIIINFKGIHELTVNLNSPAEISGKNASGKSSIRDAFHFVNWGKNAEDKETFSIKNTVDTSLNRLEHSVKAVYDIDGTELTLKRIYKEIWSTTRGEAIKKMVGHETLYEINGVAGKSQKEFQTKVDSLLPLHIAKLITNPLAFNNLKAQPGLTDWQVKREVLVKIAGEVTDKDIVASIITEGNKESLMQLMHYLNSGEDLVTHKKEIASKKKKIRETLEPIPARIEEVERGKPQSDDFDFIFKAIENKQKLVAKIDEAISDKVKAHREASLAVINKQNDLNRLKIQLQNLENEEKQKANEAINRINLKINSFERDKNNCQSEITQAEIKIQQLQKKIENIEIERAELRKKWGIVNAEIITPLDPDATICPSCKQILPADKIDAIKEAYEANWKADKKKRIDAINTQGQQRKDFSEAWTKEVEELNIEVAKLKATIITYDECIKHAAIEKNNISTITFNSLESTEITNLREQISLFEKIEDAPVIDDAELKQRKTTLATEIDELKIRYNKKEQIEKCDLRVKELDEQEKQLAQEIATLEQTEFTIESFTKAKMDEVERRVNKMFKLVKFQMFEKQINEGVKETCICLVNGVPFADISTAEQINAGLDIINTLSKYYNIYAPVWIDRAESVNEFYPIESQLIKLVVTKEPLKIN